VRGIHRSKNVRTEDGCIIQECLNGEPEAFGILVDKYKAGIYAFAYAKIRDFHDAQDVT
jgi:DNA-directed RNA polymerase specialized sigma24 family protein